MVRFIEGDDLTVNEEELPFKLIKILGHGLSGVVEKVQDKHTGKIYARKKIIIRGQRVKASKEKIFWNEVKIIRSFEKHHHIVRVFATYIAKREVGILLEPVADEGDLAQFLDQVAELPYGQRHNILPTLYSAFGCLAAGLDFMHSRRIRHKDIKPQNILIHNKLVIYTDFGYSLDYATFDQSTTDGLPDALTRRYSAPEVLEKEKRNKSSDIFSLGCVYLEIVAAVGTGVGDIVPQESLFADMMNEIHRNLEDSWKLPLQFDVLRQITIEMTAADRAERPTAKRIFEQLRSVEGTSCVACRNPASQDGHDSLLQTTPIASPKDPSPAPMTRSFGASTLDFLSNYWRSASPAKSIPTWTIPKATAKPKPRVVAPATRSFGASTPGLVTNHWPSASPAKSIATATIPQVTSAPKSRIVTLSRPHSRAKPKYVKVEIPVELRIPRNFYDPSLDIEGYADWDHEAQRYLSIAWSYQNSCHYRQHYIRGQGWVLYDWNVPPLKTVDPAIDDED